MDITQRNVTRNQSTADYQTKKIFVWDNRFTEGVYKNNTGAEMTLYPGMLVVRNTGTNELASMAFSATPLGAGETVIIAGLTYTSTGVTTQAEVAAAFANLAVGSTAGDGIATGTYSGTLTGYSTGGVVGNTVVFTATAKGNPTNLAATGTGALPVATITAGLAGVDGQLLPATALNLADVIGITANDGNIVMAIAATANINFCTKGTIQTNHLVFPAGVTLETVVGSKTLRDVLEGNGFHLEYALENTKTDN